MGIIADRLQQIQEQLSGLQNGFRDITPQFWVLRLAWEAVRLAWYVCAGDELGAREKLPVVRVAMADVERFYPSGRN